MSRYNLEFFTANESDTYSFFCIPKLLFTEKAFASLSAEAKLLYGLMLDRMSLSFSNGWMEDDGRVFIYFSNEEAMEHLGCAHTKASRILGELEKVNGNGLIARKKQGQGKSAKIYVKKFVVEEVKKPSPRKSRLLKSRSLKWKFLLQKRVRLHKMRSLERLKQEVKTSQNQPLIRLTRKILKAFILTLSLPQPPSSSQHPKRTWKFMSQIGFWKKKKFPTSLLKTQSSWS